MPRVFISHATADRAMVTQHIIDLLKDHDVDLWFAEDDIATGRQWERSILEGLKACDWFVVALTPRAVQSEWVKDEVHWAIKERPEHIVPVLMEDCDAGDIHIRLPRIQHVDFRTADDNSRNRFLATWGIEYRRAAQFHVRHHRLGERYTIDSPFDSRDFLREFIGYDHILNRRVLIKSDREKDRHDRDRSPIVTEVVATASLVHPAIPRVFDLATDEEIGTYSVLEHIDGKSLRSHISEPRPMSASSACDILIPICDAVHYANDRGIIHRNIKPGSIVVARDGQSYLTNFVVAKLPDKDEYPGTAVGTPMYMAPEQWSGEDHLDRRVDVWGLGVVLYELLTGRQPFHRDGLGANTVDLFNSIRQMSPIPLRDHNKTIPPTIERVCLRCLEKDPHNRYPTAAELASELKASVHERARWWRK